MDARGTKPEAAPPAVPLMAESHRPKASRRPRPAHAPRGVRPAWPDRRPGRVGRPGGGARGAGGAADRNPVAPDARGLPAYLTFQVPATSLVILRLRYVTFTGTRPTLR
jgi:hypothetical protein